MIDENDNIEEIFTPPTASKFVEIQHEDGSVEYRAENIDELNAIGAEAAASRTNVIELTEEQVAESILNQQKHEAREYLKSTDWYAARLAETGTAIPADVLAKRQTARELLST
jgi:Mn-dependent DtxR family transcriptional regulator